MEFTLMMARKSIIGNKKAYMLLRIDGEGMTRRGAVPIPRIRAERS